MAQVQASASDTAGFEAAASVVTIDEPTGIAAESIRALRTQIVTIQNRDGLRSLAVCGPTPGVGSTFVAVNLAAALSQIGLKTLLVDADMRDPAVDRMILPPHASLGLQQCLAGEAEAEDAIQHEVIENFSVLYSGGIAANPQELLATQRFRDMVDLWSREYDVTIVDTPPANQSADGRYIAAVLGAAVVVARKDHTSLSDLKTALAELEQSEAVVIGTVLNQY